MDVGALSKGGKKGKGDGQWQKGKGKKGKYEKGKTKTKGKFEGKGSKKFEGYCSYCNKWGHKKADCRIREKDRKGSGKGGTAGAIDKTDSPKNEATSGSVQYVNLVKVRNKHEEKPIDHDEDDEADDYYSSGYGEPGPSYTSWSVREVPKRTRWADEQEIADQRGWDGAASFVGSVEGYIHDQYIMYDSGSDEHVCKKDFGGTGDEVQSLVQLNAVSGDALKILGERKVILELEGMQGPIPIEVVFQVGKNCQKNILSSGKMFRKGFKSITDPDGASYLYHNKFKDKIPLFMYGNSFYLKIHNVKSMPRDAKVQKAIAAPVLGEADDWENAGQSEEDVEEIPQREVDDRHIESRMSLTPSSTIAQMRERLKALGYVIHGSKAEVWSRLKRAEKEEYKRREKEAAREAEAAGRNADVMRPGQEVRAPVGPTEAERAKHELTHLPTQTWCQHCMKGKGKEDPHRRVESGREVLQIDYSYLKSDGSYVDGNQEAAEVVLAAADRGTGMFWAMGIPTKNFEKEYVVKSICGFISQLGHMQLSIRTDGEPTILQVANEIRDEMNKKRSKGEEVKVRTEQAPRYSPQSMGAVGAAQSILKGDAMTLKSSLEEKVGLQISPAMNVWPWLIRHSAWSRARFGVKANLRTAYEDAFGSQKGIFLGKMNETDEFLIGTPRGVHSARSIRRLEMRLTWSSDLVKDLRGVPWNRETTIGRPRRIVANGGDAERSQPASASRVPKPWAAGGGPAEDLQRIREGKREVVHEEEVGEERSKKPRGLEEEEPAALERNIFSEEEMEPVRDVEAERQRKREALEAKDRAELERNVKRWKKQTEEVESRFEGGPPKKLKVGEQTIGALFSPAALPEEGEEELKDNDLEIDEDEENKSFYYPEEDLWEEELISAKPITEEERQAGKKKELEKMTKFGTFKVVAKEEAKGLILGSTWVEARKPDGSVRERYCLREFKSSSYRDDVYAVSTTSATGRIIDLIGVKKQYVFFTADATNAFWQVPIQEVCFMYPPKEWLAEEKSAGRSTDVMWQLRTEWYGRRVAGTRWVEFAAGKIMKQGFKRCEIAPWFFYNAASDISLELHMDDIYGCGPKEKVESFLAELHKEILMKSEIHKAGGEEFSHLKKKRTYKEDGSMLIQADSKHIKEVQKILGMEEAKGCPTPAVAGGPQLTYWTKKSVKRKQADSSLQLGCWCLVHSMLSGSWQSSSTSQQ